MQFDKPAKPNTGGSYHGFDHLHLWVGNAKQAADWYVTRFGFTHFAFNGLVTGSRDVATHVVRQNKVLLAFSSALTPTGEKAKELNEFVAKHGDAVKDVAFAVDNCRGIYDVAIQRGAVSVKAPYELKDEHGVVVLATIQTYGECTHTFVERRHYTGPFMPGFRAATNAHAEPMTQITQAPGLDFIDHVVGNQDDNQMLPIVQWYEKVLQFHRFWSVDDKMVHTEYSALRSMVMCDYDRGVKMPINEPAEGKKKSQIKEFVEYHGGAGVQHIALNTRNIIHAVQMLKKRGVEFLTIPDAYYTNLRARLAKSPVKVAEDLDTLQKLHILIDFDDRGYLLQLFTQPVEDRPTLFYELIQRENHDGFGAGNFKALFESIEIAQAERGNL